LLFLQQSFAKPNNRSEWAVRLQSEFSHTTYYEFGINIMITSVAFFF